MEIKNNKIEETIKKIIQASSLEEINKLSLEIFGEKITLFLRYFCPIYGGLTFSIFCRKMIKTTLIITGTGSIIYILMVSLFLILFLIKNNFEYLLYKLEAEIW